MMGDLLLGKRMDWTIGVWGKWRMGWMADCCLRHTNWWMIAVLDKRRMGWMDGLLGSALSLQPMYTNQKQTKTNKQNWKETYFCCMLRLCSLPGRCRKSRLLPPRKLRHSHRARLHSTRPETRPCAILSLAAATGTKDCGLRSCTMLVYIFTS